MNSELITQVIGLVGKTGDRLVVVDPVTGKAVVVMDLQAYERLTAVQEMIAAPAPTQQPAALAPAPVSAEISAPAEVQNRIVDNQAEIKASVAPAAKPGKREKRLPTPSPTAAEAENLSDLTQEGLLDKINRDIGTWKNAQETKRTEELQSVVRPQAVKATLAARLEEEERFYLEPIE